MISSTKVNNVKRVSVHARKSSLRRSMVVRCAAQTNDVKGRREMFSVLFAGVGVASFKALPANAYDQYDKYIKGNGNGASSIGIEDKRKENPGVQLIYEARDVDLPLKERYVFSRDQEAGKDMTPETTLNRINDARVRIDGEVRKAIGGNDWALARNQLRTRVSFLRYDLNYLVSLKDKQAKKEAIELKKNALAKIEDLDFQLRNKNQETSNAKLEVALAALDKTISFLK